MKLFSFIPLSLFIAIPLSLHSFYAYAENSSVEARYRQARNAFLYGTYQKAIKLFNSLLYPKPGKLRKKEHKLLAHQYLGLAYFYSGRKRLARRELTRFLFMKPNARFDPALYPPNLVNFFENIRKQNAAILKELTTTPNRKKGPPVQVIPIRFEKQIYRSSIFVNIIPFGVPQFLNGQPFKGSLLLTAEISSLSLNIIAYYSILSMQIRHGKKQDIGRFSLNDLPLAKSWQYTQFISFGVFSGLVLFGIIDGLIFYRSQRTTLLPILPPINPKKFNSFERKKAPPPFNFSLKFK